MILILVVILVALLFIHFTWNFNYWSKRGVPSPPPKFLLGNLPNMLLRKQNVAYDMEKIYNEFKATTPFVGIQQILEPRLLILEPELIKDVMIRKFNCFRNNEFADSIDVSDDPLFGKNLFFLKDEEWRERRAELMPAFSTNRLKALYPLIQDVLARMTQYINENKKNHPLDTRELCAKYTTDVVTSCIFGLDAESFTKEQAEIREKGKKIFAQSTSNLVKAMIVMFFPFMNKFLNIKFTMPDIQQFFVDLMEQTLQYREQNKVQREDFLDYVIQLRNKKHISKSDMSSHCISFFSDGTETSSISISNTLYEIAKSQRVQSKLREEVNKRFDKNGQIDFETLGELSYLDQVWNEGLRKHPPAPFTTRICNENTQLAYDGKVAKIEKGICLLIPILQAHNDPENFVEPTRFYPERFDDGKAKEYLDRGCFMPFGAGPRTCLGTKFATLQSKAVLATLVHNFKITVDSKTKDNPLLLDPNAFLNIKLGELWLNFEAINN